jgi:hypothetical protein
MYLIALSCQPAQSNPLIASISDGLSARIIFASYTYFIYEQLLARQIFLLNVTFLEVRKSFLKFKPH